MKKLFALLAVVSLAAIGCDDKSKTTGKPTSATNAGGTYVQTDTARRDVTNTATATVVHNTVAETRVNTVLVTTTVTGKKPDGPGLPGDKDKGK